VRLTRVQWLDGLPSRPSRRTQASELDPSDRATALVGGIIGVWAAPLIFELPLWQLSAMVRGRCRLSQKALDDIANPELWKPKDPWAADVARRNSEITQDLPASKKDTPASHCPRPSTIFDLTMNPVDFRGPQIKDAAAKHAVALKLGWKPGNKPDLPELKWGNAPSFDFSELLWLMGDMSDNVAATACISEIGVAYLKAAPGGHSQSIGRSSW
jgi:hypothetical protein